MGGLRLYPVARYLVYKIYPIFLLYTLNPFSHSGHCLRVNIKIEGVLYPENVREKMTPCHHKITIIII